MKTSLQSERVIRVLEQIVAWLGQPKAIRIDNGLEFIAERFMARRVERTMEVRHIQSGKPDQNAFMSVLI